MKQKPFLTEEDIKKLETRFKKIFLTKQDAKNFLTMEASQRFATKFDLETFREDIIFKMEELLTRFRSEMYEKIDPILIEKQISLPSTT